VTILATMAALADPDAVRRKANEVISRPEFDLRPTNAQEPVNLVLRVILWIIKPFVWFLEQLGDIGWPLKILIVTVLVLLLAALLAHLAYSFMRAIQGPRRKRERMVSETPPSPEALEAAARQRAKEGDFIGAIRALFKAALVRIEAKEEKPFRKGITNREILRRYRTSRLFEPMSRFVDLIDSRWYGDIPCDGMDFETCKSEYERICSVLEGRPNAVRP
jgi:hypothetical protein